MTPEENKSPMERIDDDMKVFHEALDANDQIKLKEVINSLTEKLNNGDTSVISQLQGLEIAKIRDWIEMVLAESGESIEAMGGKEAKEALEKSSEALAKHIRREVKETLDKDAIKSCFELVKEFTGSMNETSKSVIGTVIYDYLRNEKGATLAEKIKKIQPALQAHLKKVVRNEGTLLEANTPELQALVNEIKGSEKENGWNEEKRKAEIFDRREKIKSKQEQIHAMEDELKKLEKDLDRMAQIKTPTDTDSRTRQALIDKRNDLSGGKDGKDGIEPTKKGIKELEKEIVIIEKATLLKGSGNIRTSPDNILMHINAFFYKKEKEGKKEPVNEMEMTEYALNLAADQMSTEQVKNRSGHTDLFVGATKDETVDFIVDNILGDSVPEGAKKILKNLKKIGQFKAGMLGRFETYARSMLNADETRDMPLWIATLKESLPEENREQKLKAILTKFISTLGALTDKERFWGRGLHKLEVDKIIEMKYGIINGYKGYMMQQSKLKIETKGADREQAMQEVWQQMKEFDFEVAEATHNVNPTLPDELKAFLKTARKDHLQYKLMRGSWKAAAAAWKGGWPAFKAKVKEMREDYKKNPGKLPKQAFLVACGAMIGLWPTAATWLTYKAGKEALKAGQKVNDFRKGRGGAKTKSQEAPPEEPLREAA